MLKTPASCQVLWWASTNEVPIDVMEFLESGRPSEGKMGKRESGDEEMVFCFFGHVFSLFSLQENALVSLRKDTKRHIVLVIV